MAKPWHGLQYSSCFLEWRQPVTSIVRLEVPEAIRTAHPFLAFVTVPYAARPNGLPDTKSLDQLHKIEHTMVRSLEAYRTLDVGHNLGGGWMRIGCYCGLEPPRSLSVSTGLLKKQKIDVNVRRDPEWAWYDENLGLAPWEMEVARYQGLLVQLRKAGDNPEIERDIDVGVVFPSPEARSRFIPAAEAAGYPLTPQGTWDHPNERAPQFWCELSATTTLEPRTIGATCVRLRTIIEEHGGDFDGWASHVCT
jgi:hypothetical protein